MEHILEPSPSFDFSKLACISPTSLSGGNYFIRLLTAAQQPLYIQSPKCVTKSGIIKSGKKMLCDLVFRHEDEAFLEFLESLESFCHQQIFEHREKWFESDLTLVDIENCFVSPTKSFKSGKLHILRANVPIRLGKCNLKIFDEQEQDVPLDDIKEDTSVISILEIQGIRCSARSFQLEFEIKQLMTLQPMADLFETCMLSKKTPTVSKQAPLPVDEGVVATEEDGPVDEDLVADTTTTDTDEPVEESTTDNLDVVLGDEVPASEEQEEEEIDLNMDPSLKPLEDSDLCEVDLQIPEEQEELKLKNPNEVYYEMYKEAKKKARIARDLAITSYLSVKQIKHNYLPDEDLSDEEEMMEEEKELRDIDLDTA